MLIISIFFGVWNSIVEFLFYNNRINYYCFYQYILNFY